MRPLASRTITSNLPALSSSLAAVRPATPAPTMTTLALLSGRGFRSAAPVPIHSYDSSSLASIKGHLGILGASQVAFRFTCLRMLFFFFFAMTFPLVLETLRFWPSAFLVLALFGGARFAPALNSLWYSA